MNKASNKYRSLCIYLLLTLATITTFEQVRNYEFINLDDPMYVTNNEYVRAGLSRDSVIWAFTKSHFIMWHPLTWLSHMVDCQLFGLNAGWHHLDNLLLHITNTLLLFYILMRMTNALWRSFFVAAAFALHPMHVESVAWVTERKDVLSTLFWMLTIVAYLGYIKRPVISRHLLMLMLFILGLMAKPMLVTLPFVLLLLDYWPLERMQLKKGEDKISLKSPNAINIIRQKPIRHLVIEKWLLLLFSAIFSVITFLHQRSSGALDVIENLSLHEQIGNAIVSYVIYIGKMIWPSRLAILYLHPGSSLSMVQVLICGVLLLLISVYFIYIARKWKYLTVGWLWYLGTLVPVIGLVQTGGHARADRFSYIPFTGLFIIIAWGAADLLAKWRYRKIALGIVTVVILLALAICTRFQLRHWRNNTTIFEHAIEVTENNYVAYCSLAEPLLQKGELEEAIRYFTEALRAKPDFIGALNNLGYALNKQGKYDEAEKYLRKALQIKPDFVEAHSNLAHALAHQDKLDEAIQHWIEMTRLDPNNSTTHTNLGVVLTKQGKFDEAIKHFTEALKINPDNSKAQEGLRAALSQRGKPE